MTNSDNTYGTFNKRTEILTQIDDGSTAPTTFATVAEAKSFFYTDAALAVFDECCTELQWALVGSTGLKHTIAFGTKGGNIAAADDWAQQYNSRKTALRTTNNASFVGAKNTPVVTNNWVKNSYTIQEVDSHLF